MSLTGNLEDLPLLDILQIVSFSKKTGYLSIRGEAGLGAIVFQDGFVVAAFAADTPPLDPRARLLPPGKRAGLLRNRIEMALEQLIRLREGEFDFSLTEAPPQAVAERDISAELMDQGLNAQELLLDLARGMDEDRRDSTAALEASFAEAEEPPAAEGTTAAPESFDEEFPDDSVGVPAEVPAAAGVGAGLAAPLGELAAPRENPTATLPLPAVPPVPVEPPPVPDEPPPVPDEPPAVPDEPPAAPAPPIVLADAPVSAGPLPTILLVDDEPEVRHILAEHFTRAGHPVLEAEDPDAAIKKAGALGRGGQPFLVIADLGMPTSGGTSFQGGFEVVKRLWKMNLRPPILLMTETLGASTHARARQMGISHFVFKPGLSKLDPEQFAADLRAFAAKILSDVVPKLVRAASAEKPPTAPAPAVAATPASPASVPPARPSPSAEELTREFSVLQKRLEELGRPQDPTQIAALVMRVAREFFERALLFLVKNDEVRGLGGFGPAPRGESLNLAARELLIPLAEPSIFSQVIAARRPFAGPLPEGRWSAHLMGRIGRFQAGEVALLPLLTHRETIAILYGDNADSGRPLGRLDTLEVFINQAGIALENAFLQRKLHALTAQE